MPEYEEITKAKQLLVEGNDQVYFFGTLLENLGTQDIQIQNFGGITELQGFLKALRRARTFERVTSLGIIRDAETDAASAFQSVSSSLRGADLPVPAQVIQSFGNDPMVSVFILPDTESPGMLETICLRSVEEDPVMDCIEQYFSCLEEQSVSLPNNMDKARVLAFLASRRKTVGLLGLAAKKGYWPFDSAVFEDIKQFLNAL